MAISFLVCSVDSGPEIWLQWPSLRFLSLRLLFFVSALYYFQMFERRVVCPIWFICTFHFSSLPGMQPLFDAETEHRRRGASSAADARLTQISRDRSDR